MSSWSEKINCNISLTALETGKEITFTAHGFSMKACTILVKNQGTVLYFILYFIFSLFIYLVLYL